MEERTIKAIKEWVEKRVKSTKISTRIQYEAGNRVFLITKVRGKDVRISIDERPTKYICRGVVTDNGAIVGNYSGSVKPDGELLKKWLTEVTY